MASSKPLFTMCSLDEGCFGSGKIPEDLKETTSAIASVFYGLIPDDKKSDITYHLWYDQFPPELKRLVNKIQNHSFWKKACKQKSTCVLKNVSQMDELYYSKTPINRKRGILYGATTNYDLHIDGVFKFPGIRFYRVLIGLTDGNTTVETAFPKLNASHYLNKNDYVIFDFDRALHQVKNHATVANENFRIMLKLHFCVCEECKSNTAYFEIVSKLYHFYEIVTQYIMKTGTNPESYYQFLLGILAYISNTYPWVIWSFALIVVLFVASIGFKSQLRAIIGRVIIDIVLVFLVLVFIFWARYKLFNVR